MLEILFAHEDDHRHVHPAFQPILDARQDLLSRRVGDTFGGYALSQLGRIQRHRHWLRDPPAARPTRADFGLPARAELSRDQRGAAEALLARGALEEENLGAGFLDLLDRERRFAAADKEWSQYQAWLRHRNPARAALEAAHGYDTKHAMHLVRLSRMALEILQRGEVRVRRTDDRDELLAIRDGALTYDALIALTDTLKASIATAKRETALPDAPDEARYEAMVVRLFEEVLR